MLNLLIVEDNDTQRNLLIETIQNHYPEWHLHAASNYREAESYVTESIHNKRYISLFLLDVQLTDEDDDRGGFDLARLIRRYSPYFRVPILFLTAVSGESSFALSEFHCYNYITKPYTSDNILNQIEQMLLTGYLENTLEIIDVNRIQHKIQIPDIYCIESKSHTLLLHTKSGSILTRQYTLERMLHKLGKDFVQCHRRIIVNSAYIISYDKTSQYIKINNKIIPIGRSYLDTVLLTLNTRS